MPLDSDHLLKPDVALDALIKASDLQSHVLNLLGRLQRLTAIYGLSAELEPEALTRKAKAVGDTIIADFRTIQMYITLLEKILSGQDPFPPPPRRHRRAVSSPIANPTEEKQ